MNPVIYLDVVFVTVRISEFIEKCRRKHKGFVGVNIIPKKADFLDPKIIFCPQFKKKCPQLNFFFKFH